MRISRRSFLGTTALSSLAANAAFGAEVGKNGGLPTRVLGRTDARVSILAMGGGSRFLMYKEEDKALEALKGAAPAGSRALNADVVEVRGRLGEAAARSSGQTRGRHYVPGGGYEQPHEHRSW